MGVGETPPGVVEPLPRVVVHRKHRLDPRDLCPMTSVWTPWGPRPNRGGPGGVGTPSPDSYVSQSLVRPSIRTSVTFALLSSSSTSGCPPPSVTISFPLPPFVSPTGRCEWTVEAALSLSKSTRHEWRRGKRTQTFGSFLPNSLSTVGSGRSKPLSLCFRYPAPPSSLT